MDTKEFIMTTGLIAGVLIVMYTFIFIFNIDWYTVVAILAGIGISQAS